MLPASNAATTLPRESLLAQSREARTALQGARDRRRVTGGAKTGVGVGAWRPRVESRGVEMPRRACVVRALRQLYVSHARAAAPNPRCADVQKQMPAVRCGISSRSVGQVFGLGLGLGEARGRGLGLRVEMIAGDCQCHCPREFAIEEPRARAVPASEVGGVRHRDLRAV